MAMMKPNLEIGLGLNKLGLSKGLAGARKDLDGLDKSARSSVGTLGKLKNALKGLAGKAIGFAGGILLANTIAKVAGAVKSLLSASKQFDEQMRNVNSIAQLGEKAYAGLYDQVLMLAEDKRITDMPAVLAAGLYDIVSSGFDAADAITILRASAIAATAGLTDTATSAAAVTAVLNAYGLQAQDATKVSNQLFQIVDSGVLTYSELANTIGTVLPTAAALGVSLDDVGAAIITMTRQGISADTAMTDLSAIMTGILKPTENMQAGFVAAGYASGQAALDGLGFAGTMDLINRIVESGTGNIGDYISNVRDMRGIQALAAQGGAIYAGAIEDMTHAQDGAGATAKALAEQMKSLSFQTKLLKKNVVLFFTEGIGAKFTAKMAKAVADVNRFFDTFFRARRHGHGWLDSILAGMRKAIVRAFGRDALKAFDAFIAAMRPIVKVVSWVVRTFWALIKPFARVFAWFDKLHKKGLNPVSAAFRAFGTALEHFKSSTVPLQRIINDIGHAIAFLANALDSFLKGDKAAGIRHLHQALNLLGDAVRTAFDAIPWKPIAAAVWAAISTIFDLIPWVALAALLLKGLVALWNAIPWETVGSAIWDGISAAFDWLIGAALPQLGAWGLQLLNAFFGLDWSSIGGDVWAGLQTAFAAAVGFAVSAAETLAGWGYELLKGLWHLDWGKVATDVWNGVWSALQMVGKLGAIGINAVVGLAGDLAAIRDDAGTWIRTALNWTGDKTIPVGKVILQGDVNLEDTGGGGKDQGLISKVSGWASAIPGLFVTAVEDAFTAGQKLADLASWIVGKVFDGIVYEFQNVSMDQLHTIGDAIGGALLAVTVAMDLPFILVAAVVAGFFTELAKDDAVKPFRDWASNIVATVKGQLGIASPSTVFAGIGRDLIAGLFGAISFNDVFNFFWSVGRAITGGLVSGISSLWSEYRDQIDAIISKAQEVKSALQVSSPSRFMHKVFHGYMQGAVLGIAKGMPAYARAVDRVSNTATNVSPNAGITVNPAAVSGQGRGSIGGGGPMFAAGAIVIKAAPWMDEDALAEKTAKRIRREIVRLRAAGV